MNAMYMTVALLDSVGAEAVIILEKKHWRFVPNVLEMITQRLTDRCELLIP